MGKKYGNEKGLSLVEVLLSIVLLTIILTSFAGFFSQSAMFVKKNEEKLSTSQTAQKVVNLIEINLTKTKLDQDSSFGCSDYECELDISSLSNLTGETIDSPYIISAYLEPGEENLVKVKVHVNDPRHPGSFSETYTYIRR